MTARRHRRGRWRDTHIEVATVKGQRSVSAVVLSSAPGLALHATLKGKKFAGFTVTHVPSGRAVIQRLATEPIARAVVLQIAHLGDWSRPFLEVMRDEALARQTKSALERIHASIDGGVLQ